MTLEKLFDKQGNVDIKKTNELYLCAFSNGDHKLFKTVYDKTGILPLDFRKNFLKYYGFLKDFQNGEFIEKLRDLSNNAYFKYSAGLSNKDYKIFMSPIKKGILPDEMYINPEDYILKIENLEKKNLKFSEPLNKLENLYKIYLDLKFYFE